MLNQPKQRATGRDRRAFVILMVLIVIVVLSLAAYHYADLTLSESKVAEQSVRLAQVRLAGDAGINWAIANLATPDRINTGPLNGLPFNNQYPLHGKAVGTSSLDARSLARWSIVSPVYQDDGGQAYAGGSAAGNGAFRFGFIDEGGKLDLNAAMKADKMKGVVLYKMLLLLPNMTDEIAAS